MFAKKRLILINNQAGNGVARAFAGYMIEEEGEVSGRACVRPVSTRFEKNCNARRQRRAWGAKPRFNG
jgi:hypothetical protein